MVAGDDAWHVNVRFAVAPLNARVALSFDGVPGTIDLRQVGKEWRYGSRPPNASLQLKGLGQRDNLVVFDVPVALRVNGVAIGTGSGDRIPASAFVAPVYPSATQFNATDIVLLLVFVVTAAYGYRRGALVEAADLIAIMTGVAIAAVAFRPVAAVLARITEYPRGSAALGSGILVLASATVGFLLVPRLTARFESATHGVDPVVNGAVGSLTACLRQLPVLAMVLTIGTDVAVLRWASPSINSSALGTVLLHAWKTVFSIG